ncbi:MAG: hypothetical protein FWE90_00780 [Defluviitaleaceae bacterium]|nr:hypothetical protein [Defluviitaleaceae bacterium]
MLTKITNPELLTTREAEKKYPAKHFYMHITEEVDPTGQRDKGYVLYTADKAFELHDVPHEEINKKRIAIWYGNNVEEAKGLGDVIYHGAR